MGPSRPNKSGGRVRVAAQAFRPSGTAQDWGFGRGGKGTAESRASRQACAPVPELAAPERSLPGCLRNREGGFGSNRLSRCSASLGSLPTKMVSTVCSARRPCLAFTGSDRANDFRLSTEFPNFWRTIFHPAELVSKLVLGVASVLIALCLFHLSVGYTMRVDIWATLLPTIGILVVAAALIFLGSCVDAKRLWRVLPDVALVTAWLEYLAAVAVDVGQSGAATSFEQVNGLPTGSGAAGFSALVRSHLAPARSQLHDRSTQTTIVHCAHHIRPNI